VPLLVASIAACSSTSDVTVSEANTIDATTGADDTTSDDPSADTTPGGTEPGDTTPGDPEPNDTAPGDTQPGGTAGTLDWRPCPSEVSGAPFECATLEVPLDHAEPDGDQIDLAVKRLAADDPDERIGSLVFNPGGPGGSGLEFLENAALAVPEEFGERFDLVSFDPRGVGASTAIDCEADYDDDITLLAEGDRAGWDDLAADAVATECTDASRALEPFVGTNSAARDLDLLRAALGDEQLSYVGFSYGTRLGATYADLFPDRVRALVLDGAVKPSDDEAALAKEQAGGFDRALENFAEACDADDDCALASLGPALEVIEQVRAEVAAAGELATDDPDRVLTPGELDLAIVASLYSTQLWPLLAQGLVDATDGDGSLLQALADSYAGREPDGTYSNLGVANVAINCADTPDRPTADEQYELAEETAAGSTYFADFLRASTGCIGTVDPIDPIRIGPAAGAAPILVIGTTGDPATPYEWAVELADALESAVLFTVEAEGHTAFLDVECVNPVVVAYLVDLEVPDEGASCSDPADDIDEFPPAGSSDLELIVEFFDCLRDNGADVPEITVADVLADPTGEDLFGGLDLSDPDFAGASFECQDIIADL
jgi:pimeloyl-ACP methyl ester carboxylesterase